MDKLKNIIFSYGTLADKFPKEVIGEAELNGRYSLDESGMFPSVRPGDHWNSISGVVLELDDDQLKVADEYENGLYKRVELTVDLKKGGSVKAGVYIEFKN